MVETRTAFCDVAQPIRPTQADAEVISDQLVGDILTHNELGTALGCWPDPVG